MATINVGLARPAGGTISIGRVLSALNKVKHPARAFKIEHSATEPTLVVRVDTMPTDAVLMRLSVLCEQEAVAAYNGKRGALVGPKAHKWGTFNLEFFIR